MRKIIKEDGRITLFPDDGMVLTNGETYGVEVTLESGLSDSGWYEITTEEYEEILEKESEILLMEEIEEKAMAYDIMNGWRKIAAENQSGEI